MRPPLPQREHLPAIDDRIGIDIGQRADLGGDRGATERIGPQIAPVLVAIGNQFAGGIPRDHRARGCRGCGHAEHARLPGGRRIIPDLRTVRRAQRVDLVVLRHHIDRVEGHRGRTAQRSGRLDAPDLAAVLSIECDDIAGADRCVDPAIGEGGAARPKATSSRLRSTVI